MLKKEEQTISIMAFLVLNYREAWNHGGNYEAVSKALSKYNDSLVEEGVPAKEVEIIYLKAKIRANEEQIKKYNNRIGELIKR